MGLATPPSCNAIGGNETAAGSRGCEASLCIPSNVRFVI